MPPTQTDPRAFLRALYDAAIARAQPQAVMPAHLPPPPKGRTVVIGGGKASGAMAAALDALWPADAALDFWGDVGARPFIVLTGGEPMLQIDDALIAALHARDFQVAIESNGTLPAHPGLDWVCISPKAGSHVVQRSGTELKLVWPQPGSDVEAMESWGFDHFLIQPLDDANAAANHQAAIDFVLAHPKWRLSVQTHKVLGLR